jgi:predicted ferric reductase
MLRALSDRRDTRLHILIAAHSSWERATFCESVLELKKRLNLNVIYVLDHPTEGWRGEKGHITRELLARYLPAERHSYEYFVCGPVPMIDVVEKGLYELGVPMSKFHTELFDLV